MIQQFCNAKRIYYLKNDFELRPLFKDHTWNVGYKQQFLKCIRSCGRQLRFISRLFHLRTWLNADLVQLFVKVSQSTVKECILNSAPKSCDLDPIPSKLVIECLYSTLPSLTDLFNSSLASGIFPQCFKSALVTPILRKVS